MCLMLQVVTQTPTEALAGVLEPAEVFMAGQQVRILSYLGLCLDAFVSVSTSVVSREFDAQAG